MSLVILRNKNGQSPAAFDNDFQNTFTVPAHSEVALHSISLNRSNNYDISDRVFFIYHGTEFDSGGPFAKVQMPQQIELKNGSYSVDALASHIQAQLRSQDIHPNYQQKWSCTPEYDTGGTSKQNAYNTSKEVQYSQNRSRIRVGQATNRDENT